MNPKMDSPSLLLNLPSEITTDILLKLPIRTVATCKCVCTKWLKLTSSPEFAKYHLLKSSPGLIVTLHGQPPCRIIEFDDVPLHYKPLMEFNPIFFLSGCWVECSVDGLLCLREPDYDNKVDTLYICNPVTQEYIHLPGLKGNDPGYPNTVTCGIGISTLTCQYKVVRIFQEPVSGGESRLKHSKLECMIYTLGTGSWRNVEPNMVFEYSIRPSNAALQHHDLHYNQVMKFDPNILSSSTESNIGIECSYNGLLCLRESESELDTLYVCNPITREYIPLPVLEGNAHGSSFVIYGIGMSALSCEYKVVRIFHEPVADEKKDLRIECMVFTLGTGSWRSVEANDQIYQYSLGPPKS